MENISFQFDVVVSGVGRFVVPKFGQIVTAED